MVKKFSDVSKIHRQQKIFNILRLCSDTSALSVSEVHLRLVKDGLDVSPRTVARDIEEMSITHKLCSTESMPLRYFASGNFKPEYQLNFNEDEIQTIMLALEGFRQMSPHYFKDLCIKTEATLLGKLPESLTAIFEGMKEISHVVPPFASEAVAKDKESIRLAMEALKLGKVFECQYHSPYKAPEKKKRVFHPLLLVMEGGDPYFFVFDESSASIKKIKLSRLREVRPTDKPADKKEAKKIKNLDLAIGGYGGLNEPVVDYIIECDQILADMLDEKRLHPSQTIERFKDKYIVKFKSQNSLQIVHFLAGYGNHLHTVHPQNVYEKIKEIWRKGLESA